MASSKVHLLVGAGVSTGAYFGFCQLTNRKPTFAEAVVAGATGALVALVPDILEPALHPNHRSLFHSVTGGAALVQSARGALRSTTLTAETKFILVLLLIGYVSHLLADAATPKGLPVLY